MITRRRSSNLSNQNKLSLKSKSTKAPNDIVDLDQPLNTLIEPLNTNYTLFDYFAQKDGIPIIKKWSKSFNKKDDANKIQSYQELLCLILQMSGSRIELKSNQIETDSFDRVLEEFRNNVEKSKQCPPLYKLLKEKSNKLMIFWKEISESFITNNLFANNTYKHFIEWISAFNCCKIRVIRLCSTIFICSLFESLANSISWRKEEIEKIRLNSNFNSKYKSNDQQCSLFEQEVTLYTSITNDLYKTLIIVRIHDIDDQIRNLTIKSLTNAIVANIELFDEERLKYIGRALNDTSSLNRLDALKCCEKIILHENKDYAEYQIQNEDDTKKNLRKSKKGNKNISLPLEEKNENESQIHNALIGFSEMYSPRIIEMCNDSNEDVCAEAIHCLGFLLDKQLIDQNECQNVQKLISDDSEIIRKAAAEFVAKKIFIDSEDNDDLDHFLLFSQNFNINKDFPFLISYLYPYLKCLKKWNEMCDRLIAEENDDQSIVISALLLYSAKAAFDQAENSNKNNRTKSKSSQESSNSEKAMKKVRKLTSILIQNLPQLLKAYQSSGNKAIILNLVEVSSLLDLNTISESSCEKQYEKLLNQLHEIFVKCDQNDDDNISLFNAVFNSIYTLSKNHNQLSEIAQKELDKLSIIFSNFGSSEDEDKDDDEEEDDEKINNILAKFVAAAKLVDISANEKLKKKILHKLSKKLKKYESFSQSEIDDSSTESEHDDNEEDESFISNSIECLQYYFKWDAKKVHDFLINRKFDENEAAEITEKIDKMKEPYINEFQEFSNIFSTFLKSEKASFEIKLSAFKALGTIISFSPILTHETVPGLPSPFISTSIVNDDVSDSFYSFYHQIESLKMKNELFEMAQLPLDVKAIDIGYSANLFAYNYIPSDETSSNNAKESQDTESSNEITEKVKKLWKNMSQFRPINGMQLYSSFSSLFAQSQDIKNTDLRRIARFFVGKFRVADFIREWCENKDEDEKYLPIAVTFLFGINETEANQLRGSLSDRFEDVIDKISNGDKITSKDVMKLQIVKKPSKKKGNSSSYFRMSEKSKKNGQKVAKHQSFYHTEEEEDNNDKFDEIRVDELSDAIEVVESTDYDEDSEIRNNVSFRNENKNQEEDDESENENEEENDYNHDDYDDSDVQELGSNESDNETSDSNGSEIEFEEPDESFVFRS